MNRPEDNWNEVRSGRLIASADRDAAAPDPVALERLRQRSTEEFIQAQSQSRPSPKRKNKMFLIASRAAAGALAASIMIGVYFLTGVSTAESQVTLGEVLDKLATASTVHLKMTRDGTTSDIWTRRPGRLRWERGEGLYTIAQAGKTWEVDEKANRATVRKVTYFGNDQSGVNLLALLGLDGADPDALTTRPVRSPRINGVPCHVYDTVFTLGERRVQVEAITEAKTDRLRSLAATARVEGQPRTVTQLAVVAVDAPVDEDKFVVGGTLTEDGRIGKVVDTQGIVSLKPVMGTRFTPAGPGMLLRPGDWVRTDTRGANALALRLVRRTHLTLGPATLVELTGPKTIRLVSGVLKVIAADESPVELLGPGDEQTTVRGTVIYRLDKQAEKLVSVAKPPLWLQGFEGARSNESLGSLVVEVEGRNVPLTVGYHKVTVDVRDQIARTVIEESFVNHTDSQLEGVFHFPLPQDASISGFGMWIGDELVEADVVEKQRAREIYETILREKRDPGLLEWTGGNIFKARVFPIVAHSEKRIKITYTQVLPRHGNTYRYSYALQSQLLQQHPLRELAINFKVNSAIPLVGISSPTHSMARVDVTQHSAHVEFSAQEYTPTRDFEVVVETDGKASDVVMIPHRRGDDGYFMIQLTPPATGDVARSDLLPDGEPLDLLVLADTSASLSDGGRQVQAAFLASLLSSLTRQDQLNVATCDVDCYWAFDESRPATADNIDAACRFVNQRHSLGWTDLDRAFASAVKRCGSKTQVVYVGDGVITTGDGDPVAFSQRLRRTAAGKAAAFHGVSVSSSFEPLVLKTVASLGGGSARQISSRQGASAAARELMAEITRPGLKDLKVELRGLRTARVYPEEMPNLPAGTQQILLGRYLPERTGQSGEVIVTGQRAGETIRMTHHVSLADAEQGNSFIPRLWARMHLDALLAQGSSQMIKDEIVGLSEEYHIITPYTSLLVLESDEDRERFGVKRRFLMRDAEKFFAAGRATANYELLQKQMKRAGTWRIGMRRGILSELAGLGRNANLLRPQITSQRQAQQNVFLWGGQTWGMNSSHAVNGVFTGGALGGGGFGGGGGGFGGGYGDDGLRYDGFAVNGGWDGRLGNREIGLDMDFMHADSSVMPVHGEPAGDFDGNFGTFADDYSIDSEDREEVLDGVNRPAVYAMGKRMHINNLPDLPFAGEIYRPSIGPTTWDVFANGRSRYANNRLGGFGSLSVGASHSYGYFSRHPTGRRSDSNIAWIDTLFPNLPATSQGTPAPTPKSSWTPEARALAESLLRVQQLSDISGGLEIKTRSETYAPRWNVLSNLSESISLVSPAHWLIRTTADRTQSIVHWCDPHQRGVFGQAFLLGRVRRSTPKDLSSPPLALRGHVMQSIETRYRTYAQHFDRLAQTRHS